jgi:glycosyltransferase involved in cell wall biosynthesis
VVRHGVEQGPALTPTVSVITPTLDRLEFLRRALDSLLGQTYGDFEAVVVVDGPSPELAEFVAGHPDPRVRLIQRDANGGVAAARNSGLDAARGRYIGFLDDDDLWLPTKLERQVPLLDAGADVVHSLVYVADGDGRVYERPSERGFRLFREAAAAEYPYVWLLRRSSYQISSFLVRRECVDAVGGFDPTLTGIDDLAFAHELWRRYELRLVDEPLTKYCFHDANQVQSLNSGPWAELARRELAWTAQADPPGRAAADAYLWMQIAQSAWITGRYRRAVVPALRARRLDPSVMTARTAVKYAVAALLPAPLVDVSRRRTRQLREPAEPDPWIDLATPLPG